MSDQKPSENPAEPEETLLAGLGGGPAVTTGTDREQAEQKPATVQDSASPDVPAVAASGED